MSLGRQRSASGILHLLLRCGRGNGQQVSDGSGSLKLLHETPSPSSDSAVRQPHARGWLG
jgi:hypothetical protein